MICCIQNNIYSYDITGCRLNFYDVYGTQIYQMDVDTLVFYYRPLHLYLQDAYGFQSMPLSTASSLGLTSAALKSAQSSCAGI